MFQKVRLFFLFDNSAPSNVLFLQKVRHQVSFLTHSAISKYLFDKILPSSYPPAKCAVKFFFYQQCSVKFFVSQKVRRQGLFSLKSAPKSKKNCRKVRRIPFLLHHYVAGYTSSLLALFERNYNYCFDNQDLQVVPSRLRRRWVRSSFGHVVPRSEGP